MELPRSSDTGSGNCGEFTREMAETFQFREEIQSLMADNDLEQSLGSQAENGSSFTALLGLPTNQAIELLHETESGDCPAISPGGAAWRDPQASRIPLGFSFSCSPTFPSNATLVERAAKFSVFADESAQTSSDPSNASENSPVKLKIEPADSDSHLNSSRNLVSSASKQRSGKRKEAGEKNKVKAPAKRSNSVEDGSSKTSEESKGGEKLPYVHVRARRGQATDSHSLAERARREKINARMKLLQELVPGCNKISGTALVLDEIINHVQSLQRQVENLSMRLAAVNPRIDFSSVNSFFATDATTGQGTCGGLIPTDRIMESGGSHSSSVGMGHQNGDLTAGTVASMAAMDPVLWSQLQVDGARRQHQQLWNVDFLSSCQRDDGQVFVTPESTLLDYDSANSVAQRSSQLKMEL